MCAPVSERPLFKDERGEVKGEISGYGGGVWITFRIIFFSFARPSDRPRVDPDGRPRNLRVQGQGNP